MPPNSAKNRLSVPLMYAFRGAFKDRDSRKTVDLRDEAGDRIIAGRRSSARAAITERELREEVKNDLERLMNTVAMESTQDLSEHEDARRSIINFGFPDVVHRSSDEQRNDDLLHELETVVATFEPRLVRETISVRRDRSNEEDTLKVRFLIRADLACEPLNVPVEFVADLEVDSGKIQINRK